MESINSAKKVCKEGAVCGLVESKDSKSMLVLFLHSSYRKKNNGSKPEAKQEKYYIYTRNKAKKSTFSSFQHHREFALKSKAPAPVKATPEDKASSNSRNQNHNHTRVTVEIVHPQPKEEIHFSLHYCLCRSMCSSGLSSI